jgi:O-6-methylguanine DNA methyltransferase
MVQPPSALARIQSESKNVSKKNLRASKGTTLSYAEVATSLGQPTAVWRCCPRVCQQSVAVVIPCHRVIRQEGGLGPPAGLKRKEELLAQERERHDPGNPTAKGRGQSIRNRPVPRVVLKGRTLSSTSLEFPERPHAFLAEMSRELENCPPVLMGYWFLRAEVELHPNDTHGTPRHPTLLNFLIDL